MLRFRWPLFFAENGRAKAKGKEPGMPRLEIWRNVTGLARVFLALLVALAACFAVSTIGVKVAWGAPASDGLAAALMTQASADPTCALLKKDGNLYQCTSSGQEVNQYWDGNLSISELFDPVVTLYVASDVTSFSGDMHYWERTVYGSSPYTYRGDASYSLHNVTKVVFLVGSNGRSACDTLGEGAFFSFDSLAEVQNLEKTSIATIGSMAFYGTGITSIALPATLRSMGDSAFYKCESLESVSGLQGTQLSSIPQNAFYGCLRLSSVALPDSCASVGDYSFENCANLAGVTFGSRLASIGSQAFRNCNKLSAVSLPAATKTLEFGAFSGCSQLGKVTMASTSLVSNSSGNASYSGMSYVFQNTLVSVAGNSSYIYVPTSLLTKYASSDYSSPWYDFRLKFKPIPGTPKANQPMVVKAAKQKVKASQLKKKAQVAAPITVRDAQGAVTFKKVSGNAKIKVNAKTGKFSVKKGLKKGKYTVKVKVTAKGDASYKSGSKAVTVKVVVN